MFEKSRIRNIDLYLGPLIKPGDRYEVGLSLAGYSAEYLKRVGIENATEGTRFLPSWRFGSTCKFNAFGKLGPPKKDEPKEPHHIQYSTTITDWHGTEHDVDVSRTVYRYKRERIPPPSVELNVRLTTAGEMVLVSDELVRGENPKLELHTINLILSLFRKFEVFDPSLGRIIKAPIVRKKWKFLPEGVFPWEQRKGQLVEAIKQANPQHKKVIELRFCEINKHEPAKVAIGIGGFSDYVAFNFEKKGFWVLESIRPQNATYLFGDDWEEITQMTKAEIIEGEHAKHRIIHGPGWAAQIHRLLSEPKPDPS